ncbi:MAG: phospholipid-binding protein, partial [Alcanivorax sp.]|nr:phospholipid-binding protein [Alcanivorax sp.]
MAKLLATLLISITLLTSGCASLTKGLSETPTDQDHGSRTFGAFIEDGQIERKIQVNLARASAELDESHI